MAKHGSFHGGLKLEGHKSLSTQQPIATAALPKRLYLPLQQHIGEPAIPLVAIGDRVKTGQPIARASEHVSVPIHASSSGEVIAIEPHAIPHPSGIPTECIIIETDGKDEWAQTSAVADYTQLGADDLREHIKQAGIVGLGGAGFPAYIKLNPGKQQVETLILNGAECEPYITCDDMLMREQADAVVQGMLIMRHALKAKHCIIGIEDNKPEALAAIQQAITTLAPRENIDVIAVATRYPAGGEKQLIKALTGLEVPSNGLPIQIGVVCHNVATAAAVYRAVIEGQPLISRIITVTGDAVGEARNLQVRLGTLMSELLQQCQTPVSDIQQLHMGGPMMGLPINNADTPVIKTSNCLLARKQPVQTLPASACIRCGACADVCPAQLLPQQLYWHTKAKNFDKAQDFHLFDCIECACCDYVCPSHIPLVSYYRFAKTDIWAQEKEKQKADMARERHEFRLARLEREKKERAERHAQKKAALSKKTANDDDKKAAIQAAMERAKAKKAAVTPKNTDNLSDAQVKEIEAIEQRRKQNESEEPS